MWFKLGIALVTLKRNLEDLYYDINRNIMCFSKFNNYFLSVITTNIYHNQTKCYYPLLRVYSHLFSHFLYLSLI